MAGTGVVIVSHSAKLAEGLAEIVEEMNDGSVKVIAAGGADGGRIGTSAIKIQDAIESLEDCKNILIYADMGSSIISAENSVDTGSASVHFDLKPNKVFVFDAKTEERIYFESGQAKEQ